MNGAGEVAAYDSSSLSERVVGVEAVDRVECYGVEFDEDFSWAWSRYIDRSDGCGLLLGVEYEYVHGRVVIHGEVRNLELLVWWNGGGV